MRIIARIFGLLLAFAAYAPAGAQCGMPDVYDISYDYHIDSEKHCKGTLTFHVVPPEGAKRILIQRTRHHLTDPKLYEHIYRATAKSLHDVDESNPEISVVCENLSWGCFFQAIAITEDNVWTYGTIYCTTDFLSQEDKDYLFGEASMDEVGNDSVKIRSERGILIVDTIDNVVLSLYSPSGLCLFSDEISRYAEIPVAGYNQNFVIVRYSNGNKCVTRKIIVK